MGYWGWRTFVFAFISVWICSCTTPSAQAPRLTTTQYPINITSVRSSDIKTAQPIQILPLITIIPHNPPQSATNTQQNVIIQNITCYSLPTQLLNCLGILQNTTPLKIRDISLQAHIFQNEKLIFSKIIFPDSKYNYPKWNSTFSSFAPRLL